MGERATADFKARGAVNSFATILDLFACRVGGYLNFYVQSSNSQTDALPVSTEQNARVFGWTRIEDSGDLRSAPPIVRLINKLVD